MGKYWTTLRKGHIQDWPYPELKQVGDKDIKAFYNKVGFVGTEYRWAKITQQNQESAYNKLGFAFSYVLITYFTGWILIIFVILYVIHSVMSHKPA